MKKSFISIVGIISLLFVLWGCSSVDSLDKQESATGTKLKVLSTTAMIGDIVSRVGGERIETSILIVGELDPHSYELVKGDDEKISGANLIFCNGLSLEHGASLRYKISTHPHAVSLGGFILSNYPDRVLFDEGQPDPHIWMDISLWAETITPISEALIAEDPEGEAYYQERAFVLKNELDEVHRTLKQQLQLIPQEKRYLVTSHDAFAYFTRAYLATEEDLADGSWRKRVAAPEGLSPDGQLGIADLRKVVDYLDQHHVKVVFSESNVCPDSLRKIVLACKAKKISIRFSSESLYGDAMGAPTSSTGTYLKMIEHNADVLIKEWK